MVNQPVKNCHFTIILMIFCRSDGKEEKSEGEGKDGKGRTKLILYSCLNIKAVYLY